jgi:uncharacterized protein (DUF362 family)
MNRAVSLIKIDTYEETALKDALTRCLEPLGGLGAFIKTVAHHIETQSSSLR